MPTVLRKDGYRVTVYPNDHRPAHVHVFKAGCEAVFELNCPDGPPTLRENHGFKKTTLGEIATMLNEHLRLLCEKWSDIHGQNHHDSDD